ncbi:MAG TPA: hypothetical protein VKV03_14160 [Candidatus Binataceae bacterium]|nr:hypothetical protein [Candidatus Binataceae bacterium]
MQLDIVLQPYLRTPPTYWGSQWARRATDNGASQLREDHQAGEGISSQVRMASKVSI